MVTVSHYVFHPEMNKMKWNEMAKMKMLMAVAEMMGKQIMWCDSLFPLCFWSLNSVFSINIQKRKEMKRNEKWMNEPEKKQRQASLTLNGGTELTFIYSGDSIRLLNWMTFYSFILWHQRVCARPCERCGSTFQTLQYVLRTVCIHHLGMINQ